MILTSAFEHFLTATHDYIKTVAALGVFSDDCCQIKSNTNYIKA